MPRALAAYLCSELLLDQPSCVARWRVPHGKKGRTAFKAPACGTRKSGPFQLLDTPLQLDPKHTDLRSTNCGKCFYPSKLLSRLAVRFSFPMVNSPNSCPEVPWIPNATQDQSLRTAYCPGTVRAWMASDTNVESIHLALWNCGHVGGGCPKPGLQGGRVTCLPLGLPRKASQDLHYLHAHGTW